MAMPALIKTMCFIFTSLTSIGMTTPISYKNISNTHTDEIDSSVIISTTMKSISSKYWMMRLGVIDSELIDIQAIVVKDEDAQKTCVKGKRTSEKRYLMCAGSILDRNHVLTSASCLHEALHIRHNIRAPLAVVIAPLKSTVQVIRINEYKIHANHNTNPYNADYVVHNIAILSLACSIDPENYHKIQLPSKPFMDICAQDDCIAAIYRIIGYTSNVLSQIHAPNLSTTKYQPDINNITNNQYRLKRSSDGSHLCAETGAPVMINNYTQVAIVAISCDDRKPTTKWSYTDLYINKDWIHNTLENWNDSNFTYNSTESSSNEHSDKKNPVESRGKGCANCTFNFYISIACKEKGNCQKFGENTGNIRNKTMKWQKNVYLKEPFNKKKMQPIIPTNDHNKLTKYVRKQRLMEVPQFFNTLNAHIDERIIRPNKRQAISSSFITKDFEGHEDIMKMHALVIRDEEMTSCCQVANPVRHHINADLALLIGATTPHSYVIKIIRYEMHPNYIFDVDSEQHSLHNLAILFLHCSIKQEAGMIPKLPKGINDDIGHICCGQNCNIITITQNSENHHIAKMLKALHIPPPKHDETSLDNHNDYNINSNNNNNNDIVTKRIFKTPNIFRSLRKKRIPSKLASKPPFYANIESSLMTNKDKKNSSKTKERMSQNVAHILNTNTSIITRMLTNRILQEFDSTRRTLTNFSDLDEAMASIDWDNIEDTMDSKISPTNRPLINQFTKDVVQETIIRMRIILKREEESKDPSHKNDVSEKNQFFKAFLTSENKSIDDFAQTFARIIANLLPPNDAKKLSTSGDIVIDENNIQAPPIKYTTCPPLGTPVIVNDTLIAMISYTCDDIQNWVQWKYVSVSNNLIWIRKRILASQYEPPITCSN